MKFIFRFFTLLLLLLPVSAADWVQDYVTSEVAKKVYPYVTNGQYVVNYFPIIATNGGFIQLTNEITLSQIRTGMSVTVIFNIAKPLIAEMPKNMVGYFYVTVPLFPLNAPSNLRVIK